MNTLWLVWHACGQSCDLARRGTGRSFVRGIAVFFIVRANSFRRTDAIVAIAIAVFSAAHVASCSLKSSYGKGRDISNQHTELSCAIKDALNEVSDVLY